MQELVHLLLIIVSIRTLMPSPQLQGSIFTDHPHDLTYSLFRYGHAHICSLLSPTVNFDLLTTQWKPAHLIGPLGLCGRLQDLITTVCKYCITKLVQDAFDVRAAESNAMKLNLNVNDVSKFESNVQDTMCQKRDYLGLALMKASPPISRKHASTHSWLSALFI